MKTLSLLSLLACSSALLDWSYAFPIGAVRPTLRGDSPEPNVVLQSVVVGKKPDIEIDSCDDCQGCTYNNMNIVLRRLFHVLYPSSYRYKRDGSNKADNEESDGKTIERLLEAVEELKQDGEMSHHLDSWDAREREDETRRGRSDHRKRSDGVSHRWRDEEDDYSPRKWRKGENDSFKHRSKDDEEEHHREKKVLQGKRKKHNDRKKEWREEQERRNRQKDNLADSWPRRIPEDDFFLPLQFHNHPSQRLSGEFIP